MDIKGILFDCDGVILDSEYIYVNSLVDYLATIGVKTTVEEMVCVLGKPIDAIIEQVRDMFDLRDRIGHEELLLQQRAFFQERFKKAHLEPMNHLVELLELCKEKKLKTAIVSSSNSQYLDDVINRLDLHGYFDEVIGGESVVHGKPSADIYDLAQGKIGLDKEHLIIIEDSCNGICAGKASGIYTIGYKGSVIVQDTSCADMEIRDYKELINIL